MNTNTWLASRAAATPDGVALIFTDRVWTFDELRQSALTMARDLSRLGVSPGSRIGLLARPGAEFVISLHALSNLGAVAVPLNARLRPEDLRGQLTIAEARAVLCDDPATARRVAGGDPIQVDGLWFTSLGRSSPGESESDPVSPMEQLHCVVFTSGTTGTGKPVPLTYGNLWWNALGSLLNLGSRAGDLWLNCLPLYHVGGLSILVRGVLYGVPVLLHEDFDPIAVNQACDTSQVTVVSLVSTMLRRLIEARDRRPFPASLRCVLLGGGPLPDTLLRACLDIPIPIAPTYGLTECASQVTTLRPDEVVDHAGSSGRALIGVDIAVDGRMGVPGRQQGEILLRGPSVAGGYLESRGFASAFRTGDLGRLDAEGYLFVSDRRQDLIVSGGENISPAEVEAVLLRHPAVRDVAALGLADQEWGQIVAVVIVCDPEPGRIQDLDDFCRGRLPGFKCPRRYHFAQELPRTASGKLARRRLPAAESPVWHRVDRSDSSVNIVAR